MREEKEEEFEGILEEGLKTKPEMEKVGLGKWEKRYWVVGA